jgi:hypothetical protein
VYPFATNLALKRSIVPFALYFIVKIHRHPTGLFPGGHSTSSHVLFFNNDYISSFMAAFHLGSVKASYTLLGIDTVDN